MATRKYDEDSIQRFAGLKGIRKKPTPYIGPTDSDGLWTIFREPADNAVDQALAGRNKLVHLIFDSEPNRYWIVDAGEGIPVGKKEFEDERGKKEKLSTFYVVTGLTHGGSNFDSDTISRGTHGIGIKATNAMSKRFTVWTCWKGDWWCIEYRDAALHKEPYKSKPPKLPHGLKAKRGTVVMFEPDLSLFHKGTKMQLSSAKEWSKLTSYLVKGMTVKLTNSSGETREYVSEGPATFVHDKIAELKATQTGKTFLYSSKELDVALAFADVEGSHVAAYTNGLRNVEGGEHVTACIDSLVKSLKPYLGKKDKFTPSDVKDGLLGLVNYKIAAPKFSSQTKEKLIDERVYPLAQPQLLEAWSAFWAKNKSMAKAIIARASLLRSKTDDFLKDKKLIKKVGQANKKLQSKLAPVVGNIPADKRELFIVEGDSAGGSAIRARNKSFQAIYPLKGKPLNAMEASKDKIQNNAEIVGLLAAIGVGAESKSAKGFVPSYGKIILLADADVDGPLVGRTKVMLCDGTTPTIKQLASRWERNPTPFWVWSTNTEGQLVPALAQMPMKVATKTKLVEIEFSCGTVVRSSLNHKWPVNSSSVEPSHFRFDVPYLRSDELTVGDSIRSIYFGKSESRLNRVLETYNHTVVRVEVIDVKPTDVYCMAVPEFGNFLLADSDGNGIATGNSHVNTLLLGNLHKFCPSLIDNGHVYTVRSPLYKGRHKNVVYFGMTREEVWKQASAQCDTTYLKGWGELSPEDMNVALDPEVRTLFRIIATTSSKTTEFRALLGKSPDYRKQLLGVA